MAGEGELFRGEHTPEPAPDPGVITEERPEWLPEKFAVVGEDGKLDLGASSRKMSESYRQLETKLGGAPADTTTTTEEPASEATDATTPDPIPGAGNPVVDSAAQYWAEHGELDDEHYQKLEATGISRAMVDDYIAGQEAKMAAYTSNVHQLAGGSDQYDAMIAWAAAGNYPEAEAQAFDEAVQSGNMAMVKMAVQALASSYRQANGQTPSRTVMGESSSHSGAEPYADRAEHLKDIQNPLYKTSPAFRARVRERLRDAPF